MERTIRRTGAVIIAIIVALAMMVPMEADAASKMTSSKVTGVKAVSYNSTTIKVSWNKKARASGYKIYRATSKNGKYRLVKTISKGKTTSWKNTKVKTEKTYYYKVKACQKYKKHGKYKKRYTKYSSKTHAYAKDKIRSIKPKLTAEGYNADQTKLSWTKVSGASGYKVVYLDKYGEYKKLAETKNTYYVVPAGEESKYYKVKAYKIYNGTRVYSLTSAAVKPVYVIEEEPDIDEPIDDDPVDDNPVIDDSSSGDSDLPVPELAATTDGKTVSLRWPGSSKYAAYYEVQRAEATGPYTWSTLGITTSTEFESGKPTVKFSDATVEKGKKYAYRARYYYTDEGDDDQIGNFSSIVTIDIPAVDTPDQLCVSTTGEDTYVGWGKVDSASYQLQMKEGVNGTWKDISTDGAYQDTATEERLRLVVATELGKTYYFRVRAYVDSDYSEYTNPMAVFAATDEMKGFNEATSNWSIGDSECNHVWVLKSSTAQMCYACGYYFKHGMNEVTAHQKIHALEGDSGSYGTAEYRCSKCGAYK